jgi:hypothetical protein
MVFSKYKALIYILFKVQVVYLIHYELSGVKVKVFNATFNNISDISWRSVLLAEEVRVPGEKHWPATSHRQTLLHNVVSSTPRHERRSNSQR